MANYPTSPPSFGTKSAGQTIASAHVNSLQDEVVAIGTGLLQGTAPLASSNSTVANLSVLGNSTIAGAVNISGVVALGSTGTALNCAGQIVTTTIFASAYNMNNGNVVVSNAQTTSSATTGGNQALPAQPAGYLRFTLNGSTVVVPYYNYP
jgi:hypothetical protein